MNRTKRERRSAGSHLAIAAAAAGAFALCASAAPPETSRYVLTDLETLGGEFSQALGMNDNGAVVGWSTTAQDPMDSPHAFLWQDGVMHDLGTLGGIWTEARSVNDRNEVVGVSMIAVSPGPDGFFEPHGVLWADGMMFDLNDLVVTGSENPPGSFGQDPQGCTAPLRLMVEANRINEDGTIVGCGLLQSDDAMHGIVLTPREPSFPGDRTYDWADLGALEGVPECFAFCVNDFGDVVGVSGGRAFIHDGMIRPLEFHAPASAALAINNHGTVVGWTGDNDMEPAACMWQDGHRFDLAVPTGWSSEAIDVGDNGLIIGWIAEDMGHPAQAVMWEGCIAVDLNAVTVLPQADTIEWRLEAAAAIDANGRIAGVGRLQTGAPRAFLLEPIGSAPPDDVFGEMDLVRR